jgi:hypothetical protein
MVSCFLTSFILINCLLTFPGENKLILDIRKKFNTVESNIKTYKIRECEMEEGDPSTLKGYYQGSELMKIYYQTGDNMGNSEESYYFWKGKLFFAYIVTVCNIQVPGNSCKSPGTEDRYYFHNSKLIRWIDSDRKKIRGENPLFKRKENRLLNLAGEYKKKLLRISVP